MIPGARVAESSALKRMSEEWKGEEEEEKQGVSDGKGETKNGGKRAVKVSKT